MMDPKNAIRFPWIVSQVRKVSCVCFVSFVIFRLPSNANERKLRGTNKRTNKRINPSFPHDIEAERKQVKGRQGGGMRERKREK